MTTCLGKSCSFGLLRVPFVNCCQFMYLGFSLLILRAGYMICLYQFLIIAYIFTLMNFVRLEFKHSTSSSASLNKIRYKYGRYSVQNILPTIIYANV